MYPFVIITLCIRIYSHVHIELCNMKGRQGERRGEQERVRKTEERASEEMSEE